MQHPPEGMRLCPTRTDLTETLIAHTITLTECQKRQREHFHRCPTCVHQNNRGAEALPKLATIVELPKFEALKSVAS